MVLTWTHYSNIHVDFKHPDSNAHQKIYQTNSTQQRPPWEADSHSSGQEILLLHKIRTGPFAILIFLRHVQETHLVRGTVEYFLTLLTVCLWINFVIRHSTNAWAGRLQNTFAAALPTSAVGPPQREDMPWCRASQYYLCQNATYSGSRGTLFNVYVIP
jgi:hypothetical protein